MNWEPIVNALNGWPVPVPSGEARTLGALLWGDPELTMVCPVRGYDVGIAGGEGRSADEFREVIRDHWESEHAPQDRRRAPRPRLGQYWAAL